MANVFGHRMIHEREQILDGSSKQVHVSPRPFPGSDLRSMGAFTIPARSAKQKRLAGELEQRVAERTAEFAKADRETWREIGERMKLKSHLLGTDAARYSSLQCVTNRAKTKLRNAQQVSKRVLRGISPIGETSPVRAELSSQKSSAWNRATNC